MEIILLENILNLGNIGDKVKVKDGYGRNFLLKKYISDNGKIISSKITSVSFNKQKKLTREIKKAKILGLI